MLHAFNGGFYNSTRKGFDLEHSGESEYPLGMEVWAYVPYNLLPHLLWMTESEYGSQLHVSYMDLKPRIFDAKVFFQNDGVTELDSDHPNGWGTILIAGMRLGGGQIRADLDKTDGNGFTTDDRTMSSAYIIMDITNPEQPPKVLAELRMPKLGFTTCYRYSNAHGEHAKSNTTVNVDAENHWFMVFGSGPANANGEADPTLLNQEVSLQDGQVYILDLKALVKDRTIKTLKRSWGIDCWQLYIQHN